MKGYALISLNYYYSDSSCMNFEMIAFPFVIQLVEGAAGCTINWYSLSLVNWRRKFQLAIHIPIRIFGGRRTYCAFKVIFYNYAHSKPQNDSPQLIYCLLNLQKRVIIQLGWNGSENTGTFRIAGVGQWQILIGRFSWCNFIWSESLSAWCKIVKTVHFGYAKTG